MKKTFKAHVVGERIVDRIMSEKQRRKGDMKDWINEAVNAALKSKVLKMIDEIDNLCKFNEEHFGDKDYKTSCSYYLKALFNKDKDPVLSYEYNMKCALLFSEIEYEKESLDNYSLNSPIDLYSGKWALMAYNDIMSSCFDNNGEFSEQLRENALEKIAFQKYPKLKRIKIFLENSKNSAFVRMTGSGSVIVAYYQSKKHCDLAKIQFKRKFRNYWCNTSKTI